VKLLRHAEAPSDRRADGRVVRTLLSQHFTQPLDSIVFYLVTVPGGRFEEHYHTHAQEVIWFPQGGGISVNGETYEMAPWDGVFLEPGDRHAYTGPELPNVIHLAVKMPDADDKVRVE
jgi:quercetin dioxygenase-like cupin family protein